MTCEYKKLCALYRFGSIQCDWFSSKCKYHHEFGWYDKDLVKKHTDRIRMENVRELEKEFEENMK